MRRFWKSPVLKGCLVLALCLGILLALPSAEAHPQYLLPPDLPGYDEKFMLNQLSALDQAEQMDIFFGNNPNTDLEHMKYPDYYAGCYINDKGSLVVMITEDTVLVRPNGKGKVMVSQILREATKNQNLEIREGYRHSYNELRRIQNEVRERMQSHYELFIMLRITGTSLNQVENQVMVCMEELTLETIGFFENQILTPNLRKSDAIRYEERGYNIPLVKRE